MFCPKTFGTAIEKDDHILGHFSRETCTDCNQTLVRIGSDAYTLHNTVTCIKINLKTGKNQLTKKNENQHNKNNGNCLSNLSNDESVVMTELQIKSESMKDFQLENLVDFREDELKNVQSGRSNGEILPKQIVHINQADIIEDDSIYVGERDSKKAEETSKAQECAKESRYEKERVQCDLCGKIVAKSYLLQHKKMLHRSAGKNQIIRMYLNHI